MPTKKCKLSREVLREYMAALEKLKVAEQEHKEIFGHFDHASQASKAPLPVQVKSE